MANASEGLAIKLRGTGDMSKKPLKDLFEEKARAGDGAFAIAWALMDLADAQEATAGALQRLGNGGASTHHGAIEGLAMQATKIAEAVNNLSSAVSDIGASASD